MHSKLLTALFTGFTLTLAACGGGGSSSGGLAGISVDPSGSFTGSRTTATIDNSNYIDFLTAVVGTGDLQDISLRNESSSTSSSNIQDFSKIASTTIELANITPNYQQKNVTVNDSTNCTGGGSATRNGTIDDVTYIGNLVLTFNSCIEDGITLNGSMEIVVRSYDTYLDEPDSYILKTSNLSVTNGAESYSSTAIYDANQDVVAGTATLLINALNTKNGVETLYENLSLDTNTSGVLISGRIYTEADGYITISTDSRLDYNFGATYPYTGGPILLTGKDSNIRITPIADETIQVELDLGGDDIYEELLIINANGNNITPPAAPAN